jgi:hypothetical protein
MDGGSVRIIVLTLGIHESQPARCQLEDDPDEFKADYMSKIFVGWLQECCLAHLGGPQRRTKSLTVDSMHPLL